MERGRDASLRPTVIRAVVLGVIASIIGIVLGLLINWFPAQGSTQSKKIDTFWDVLIICSVPVFVLVATVVIVSVIKFRMRPGEDVDGGENRDLSGNRQCRRGARGYSCGDRGLQPAGVLERAVGAA